MSKISWTAPANVVSKTCRHLAAQPSLSLPSVLSKLHNASHVNALHVVQIHMVLSISELASVHRVIQKCGGQRDVILQSHCYFILAPKVVTSGRLASVSIQIISHPPGLIQLAAIAAAAED